MKGARCSGQAHKGATSDRAHGVASEALRSPGTRELSAIRPLAPLSQRLQVQWAAPLLDQRGANCYGDPPAASSAGSAHRLHQQVHAYLLAIGLVGHG
jgi:hypothetical protein